jgi:hypothetical protein
MKSAEPDLVEKSQKQVGAEGNYIPSNEVFAPKTPYCARSG